MDGCKQSIFNIPPGQASPIIQDIHMRDNTNGGASEGSLGQDESKPGGGTIGDPGAVKSGNNNMTDGPRTSGRERKEPVRLNPNNPSTF